jgi:hypothetical protein
MPRLKEVWRWIKNLITSFMMMKKQIDSGQHNKNQAQDNHSLIKVLMSMTGCENSENLIPTVENILKFNMDATRVLKLVKSKLRLSKRLSLADLESYLV